MITSRVLVCALLSGFATALPHRIRDSAIDEPAVSAPDGTPVTEGSQPVATAADNGSSGSWSDSNMGYGSGMDSASSMGYGSGMDSASSMADSTSSMMMESTSTSVATSTAAVTEASSSSSAWGSYQTPSYGSGSSSWNGGSGYNDCVSQCLAQHGNAPQSWTPPPAQTPDSGSSSGPGVTHMVIVAPAQGVLRYVPFAVNASVGDTVKFMWGANNHTVTRSSELTPCNSTSDSPFSSGLQLKGAVFEQVVNDTKPVFFRCTVPGHCQQGMFGIINPPSNSGAGTSVGLMMSNWTSQDPNLAAYSSITSNMTQNNPAASRWGGNIDVASLPEWSHSKIAENVMYTRNFLASNPETMKDDGTIDLAGSSGAPLMIPQDISAALNNANTDPSAASSSTPSVATSVATSAATAVPSDPAAAAASNTSNGAATTSPKFVVALVAAAAASFFLL